jgi:hypothetical protein
LQRKLAAISALTAFRENRDFARFAQNYAVQVSEFVRKTLPRKAQQILMAKSRRSVIESGRMKRTLSAVAAAVLVSMMALMFIGGLLKKAARVVDSLRNGSG